MKNAVWTYWENPKGVKNEPAYITLCRWTMLHNLKNCCLISVTPENLDKYLPGMSKKSSDISAHNLGRIDKFIRFFKGDPRSLAIKCDLIRAHLLKHYGGIYIDSDAIILSDISHYFELLEEHGFIIIKRSSHGKSHVSINFYGSIAQHNVICEYTNEQNNRLNKTRTFDFTDLGDVALNPIANKLKREIYFIPEREIQVVTFEESEKILLSKSVTPSELLNGNESVFMLYNGIFKSQLKGWTIRELYDSDYLVSKIFRRALPEQTFNSYYERLFDGN